ncbi:hypothetical protein EV652_117151 [Kribbella steppae]|uniref:Uncharacterized protein n=1 Tax=Kribbella steppae TaxID=2512223 RepID=A0A4R2H1P2_9ACTN|nr:hypothetical protein [Kribbella steppae]TCO17698.1 hypothetical protein EV652_117151 [Kribbella steppae]
MAVLGIVLIVLAVVFGLGVSVSSSASTTMEVFGVDFGVSVPTVFILGALAGVTLMSGLWLTKKGLGRGYRRRKEMKELRAQAATTDTAPATESDVDTKVPDADTKVPDTKAADTEELTSDERLALEKHTATDPTDTKQPH